MGLSLVSREKAEAVVLSLLAPHTSTLYVTHYLRLVTYEGHAIMVLIFLIDVGVRRLGALGTVTEV